MKKLYVLLLALILVLALAGVRGNVYASQHPTAPPPAPTLPEPKSPVQIDSKPELKSPEPKAPIDLKAPEASQAPPKAPTGK